MEIDTSGPLRIIRERDGLNIVGEGMLFPVESEEEAEDLLRSLTATDEGSMGWVVSKEEG